MLNGWRILPTPASQAGHTNHHNSDSRCLLSVHYVPATNWALFLEYLSSSSHRYGNIGIPVSIPKKKFGEVK